MGFFEKYLDLNQLVTKAVGYLPRLVTGLVILLGFWEDLDTRVVKKLSSITSSGKPAA